MGGTYLTRHLIRGSTGISQSHSLTRHDTCVSQKKLFTLLSLSWFSVESRNKMNEIFEYVFESDIVIASTVLDILLTATAILFVWSGGASALIRGAGRAWRGEE